MKLAAIDIGSNAMRLLIVKVFEDDLVIKSVKQFRIILKQNHFESMSDEYLYTTDKKVETELTSGLQSKIDFLISCSTLHYKDEASGELIMDFYVDDELKKEGEARELMRNIQKLRKKAGLTLGKKAAVQAPLWPEEWKEQIEKKTNSKLVKGEELKIEKD